jgi:hypothetical protein
MSTASVQAPAASRARPANAFARQVAELRQSLADALKPEDFAAIALALLVKARSGDVGAARLLFQYVLGKPGPMPQPDRIDIDEWERFKETAPMVKEMCALMDAPPADFLLALARQVRPIVGDRAREMLAETLRLAREQCHAATIRAKAPMETDLNGDAAPPGDEAWLELERRLRAACQRPEAAAAALS